MITDSNYSRYLSLKNKLSFSYKGIRYNKVLAHDIGRVVFNKEKFNFTREILKNLFFSLDISPLLNAYDTYEKVLLYSIDRADYKLQVDLTTKDISSIKIILIAKLNKKFSFNPMLILSSFWFTYKRLKKEENILNIIFITSRIAYYKSIHNKLLTQSVKVPFGEKKLILFNSAYSIENLLCQYYNLNNYQTFSLSHSFFVPYKKFTPIDIINGENIVSDKILVWGNASINDLCSNYNFLKSKVLVAGNPKYLNKQISIKQTFKNCIVFLGRKIYDKSNLQIIEIIKELNKTMPHISFSLKLHLSLDLDYYEQLCIGSNINIIEGNKTLENTFKEENYDFALVNNSTVYYEAMYYDMICFRFFLSENEEFEGLADKFIDAHTLKERIDYFSSVNYNDINYEVETLLRATLGMGINKYKEILD